MAALRRGRRAAAGSLPFGTLVKKIEARSWNDAAA